MKNYNSRTGLKILLAALCMFAGSKTANAQENKNSNDLNYVVRLNPTRLIKTSGWRESNLTYTVEFNDLKTNQSRQASLPQAIEIRRQDSIRIEKQLTETTFVYDSVILECNRILKILNKYMNDKSLDFAQITEIDYLLNRLTEMGKQVGNLQNQKNKISGQFNTACYELRELQTIAELKLSLTR